MEYLLEYLDKLVADATNANSGKASSLSSQQNEEILKEVVAETDKLRLSISAYVFQLTKEKEIGVIIRNHQEAIATMLNMIYVHEQQIGKLSKLQSSFYNSFSKIILSLLFFIEDRFPLYFDKKERAPIYYLLHTSKEIKKDIRLLGSSLDADRLDPVILNNLISRLGSFEDNPVQEHLTYRDISYRKELVSELKDFDKWNVESNLFSRVNRFLICMNFNDKDYINNLVNQVAGILNEKESQYEKMDVLLLYSKFLHQLQEKADFALHAEQHSVKTQLSNWILEELYYFERRIGFINMVQQTGLKETTADKITILCHLSVDQLGIFFRAAAETKFISASSQRALFEKITLFISTPYKKIISADSMRSKSYSPESKDIETVKDMLMQLYRKVAQY